MNRTPRPKLEVKAPLLLFVVLFVISKLPLPAPLTLCGFVAATLWLLGIRRGGQALLIASPLFVALISMVYLPVSERAAATFVLAYILGLVIFVVVDGTSILRRILGRS